VIATRLRRTAVEILEQGGLDTPAGREAYCNLDAWLRSDHRALNPGTTADLISAALFVALREKQISPTMPFAWHDHPFANASGSDTYNQP
jgi:triphosphoribosyl-dephospho-CoA synthase